MKRLLNQAERISLLIVLVSPENSFYIIYTLLKRKDILVNSSVSDSVHTDDVLSHSKGTLVVSV